ncbi:MAG TPA: NB-ARC domain-containing protein [Gemmatimonadaceae bacterium]|nr:NB-ARC domain-containing protein [Gemmatimonadaceae bacterium]
MWRIQLLGGLRATRGNAVLAQFPSRPVATLLALLALNPQRRHSREEVIEMLWPGVELDVGRNRLRQVLSTLRRLLEPPDVPPESVLLADRQTIGLNSDAVSCDASEFEQLLRRGAIAQALECYRGDFLPGFLDEWVEDERTRLSALHARALVRGDAAIEKARSQGLARDEAQRTTGAERPRESRNLPSYVSVFFDREEEKHRILDALAEHRLITLAGLGGFGKTRLTVESARAAEGFDPVAFVPLAECNDAALIGDCIRGALRMEATQENALAQLCAFLSERDVLLVLDNFEQLVDDGTRVVLDLLERLPRLRCLVTSRRVLDVPGEHVLTIDPLPVPQPSMDASEAVATPSLALFIDRARGARADFALTDDNRATLIELTRALEGLPLAIEIAASRIRTYSPREMRDALAERFDLLTRQGQRGTRYGRHGSMEATIEWSWNLLSDAQQRFFSALSVFRAGFGVAAVEAVCGSSDARAQLEALVSASLVGAVVDATSGTRFSILDTLREFAHERLSDARELRARHRAYFLEIARRAAAADDAVAEREMPNVKHALVTAMEDGDAAYALDLAVALRPHWEAHGTAPDELRLLGEAADRCTKGAPSLHAGLNLLAQLSLTAGDSERARSYAQRALKEADEPTAKAAALIMLARIDWERDQRDKGIARSLDEALALAAKAGAENVQADALHVKGTIALKHGEDDGDFRAADGFFERAEALYRKIGRPRKAHRVLLSRVGALTGLKRYKEARKLLAECERYFGELDSVADLIAVANMTGFLESAQEHWKEALAAGRRVVQLAWERHAHLWLATALWNLPQPLLVLGEVEAAERLTSFAVGFWERGVGPLSAHDAGVVEKQRKSTAKKLGAQRAKTLWAEGAALSLAEAVQLALTGRD